ncbi:MAG TPA: hypothetical protein VF175_03585, partial [Lacipirellula sp.]
MGRGSRRRVAPRQSRGLKRRRSRRGVLLLVVLSMLVLFLMIGTAFIITAKQSERAAKAAQRGTARVSASVGMEDLLDEAIRQLVRDTNNPNSSLRFHSLLADLYGTEGFRARIANVDWATTPDLDGPSGSYVPPENPTGGQLLHFELVPGSLSDMYGQAIRFHLPNAMSTPPPPLVEDAQFLSPLDNAYNGLVLTFLSGPCKDQSVRIVGYRPPNPSLPDDDPMRHALITVMCPESEYGGTLTVDEIAAMNAAASTILVNGRPFTGTGFGLNPDLRNLLRREATARLSLHERVEPGTSINRALALMPDYRFFNPELLAPAASGIPFNLINSPKAIVSPVHLASILPQALPTLAQRIGPAGIGGADESYDAADYQNMALAIVPEANQLTETALLDLTPATIALGTELQALLTDNNGNPMVIPSWHRPALINYWARNIAPGASVDIRESPLAQEATGALLLRRIMMRPNWIDHRRFTGSNPEYAAALTDGEKLARMVYGPWDVDNDNDGVRDSVWVDAGLPLMPGRHGKLVKPLVAMLVIDLDSKLNVNAHGTLDLAKSSTINGVTLNPTVRLAGNTATDRTPRGSGYGPGDISLDAALTDPNEVSQNIFHFRWVLEGHDFGNGRNFPGRYGFGQGAIERPGVANYRDLLSQINQFGWPEFAWQLTKFATPPDLRARYGLGINLLGQPVFEATLSGEVDNTTHGNLIVDSPYELNLSRSSVAGVTGNETLGAANMPFSLAELERVYRMYDADAGTLPDRLAFLSGVLSPNGSIGDLTDRLKFSTDTFDLPTPSVGLTRQMLNYSGTSAPSPLLSSASVTGNPPQRRLPRSIAELMEIRIRARLNQAGVAAPLFPERITDAGAAQQLRGIMRQLLAPELADGTRLNINRPFGNGYDDDGDGAVDEQGELTVDGTPTKIWPNLAKRPETSAASTAFDGGGNPTAGAAFPQTLNDFNKDGSFDNEVANNLYDIGDPKVIGHRQLLARHLYVLALTLNAPADFRLNSTPDRVKEDVELARRMAQWCVNAVDFRDADSKMTLFEYDVDPFDGWDVDGVVGFKSQDDDDNHRGLVIGAARPELVMTETLAWHDRRTDDTGSEEPFPADQQAELMKTPDAENNPDVEDPDADKDYDQLVRPRGAFFLELYNPWPSGAGASPELHANAAPNQAANTPPEQRQFIDAGVNLSAVSEAWNPDTRQRSPVWRFAVYKRLMQQRGSYVPVPMEEALEWDPDHPDPEKRPPGQPDRIIYLTDFDPKHDGERGVHFRSSPNGVRVRPGRYLVIGSGEDEDGDGVYETIIADRKGMRNPDDPNRDRVRRIELDTNTRLGANNLRVNSVPNTVRMVDADDDVIRDITANQPLAIQAPTELAMTGQGPGQLNLQPAYLGDTSLSVTDVAIVDKATDPVTKQPIDRPMSLSAPFDGYPTKFRGSEWSETRQEYRSAEGGPLPIDVPLDGPIGGELRLEEQFGPIEDGQWPSYLATFNDATRRWESRVDPVLTQIPDSSNPNEDQLGASYAFIYLQRLANPQFVWNPEFGQPGHNEQLPVNPYVTVDSMTANLTVFNSRGDDSGEEEDGSPANNPRRRFASHVRGYAAMIQQRAGNGLPPTLWGTELPSVPTEIRGNRALRRPRANEMFGNAAQNQRMERELAESGEHWFNGVPHCSLGYLNRPFANQNLTGEEGQLRPQQPFSWFVWNNRPYAS